MISYDNWKSTEPNEPGPACELCGDRANWAIPVQGSDHYPVFLCEKCEHDKLCNCEDCGDVIWQKDGIRVYSSPSLYCHSCAAKHPQLILGREIEAKRDEERDRAFDDVRRG